MQVIIVDNNQDDLKLMESLVKQAGNYHSHTFHNANEGLAWCQENTPDLLIVSYAMPQSDGIEFIRRFREIPANEVIPTLLVTNEQEKSARYAAAEAGNNDFLTKPIDNAEFRTRLRNMLALRLGQKALADRTIWLAEKVAEATQDVLDRERETITRMARAAEFRDPETGAHIQRIAHYSYLIAQQLGLSHAQQELIQRAAPMHDVGKIAIRDEILMKSGRLDPAEFEIMKTHADIGYKLLRGSTSNLLETAALIAWTHHEKFDGSGYPRGLAGEAIPLFGRIVAVADVFDALTTERPYKQAWEIEHALRFLEEGAGNHFDPACVVAFIARLEDVLAVRARFQDERPVLVQL